MSITIPSTWTPIPARGVSLAQTGLVVRSQEWRVLELGLQHLAGVRLPQHAATIQRDAITPGGVTWRCRLPCPPYAYQLLVWHSSQHVSGSAGSSTEVTLTVSTQTTAGAAIDSVTLDPYTQGDEPVTVEAILEWASPLAATSAAEVDVLLAVSAAQNDTAQTVAWGAITLPLTAPWGSGTL